MRIVDFRSDTVTQPTDEMRVAMANAVVGDDMYGDDPTVAELEEKSARILGKEAALFVTSGVQGNQLCLLAQTSRGQEIIFEEQCHIYGSEAGAYAFLSGLSAVPLKSVKGVIDPRDIKHAIKLDEDDHNAKTGIICLESTHNFSGGYAVPINNMKEIYEHANKLGIPVHLDGARVFNAAAYLNCDVREITQYCDTVMTCFSKGLCAPVGSIIAGSKTVIRKAKTYRKMLGGALRQSGIIAAPAIIGLEKMRLRLDDDNKTAIKLAKGLHALGFAVDTDVHTNIVMVFPEKFGLSPTEMHEKLEKLGIRTVTVAHDKVRFVTHYYIKDSDIDYTLEIIKKNF